MVSRLIARPRKLERALAKQHRKKHELRLDIYKDDPVLYAQEVLKVNWWSKQIEIARAVQVYDRVVVQSAFSVGKTFVAAGLANWYFDSYLKSIVLSTAPTHRQVRHILWAEIGSQRRTTPKAMTQGIKDPDDPRHYALGATVQDPTAFLGIHQERLLFIMDEAAGVPRSIWDITRKLATGSTNKVFAIGNPLSRSSAFYDACQPDSGWHHIHISALEHPNIVAALAGEPEPYPGAISVGHIQDILDDPFSAQYLGSPEDGEELAGWKNERAIEWLPGSDEWYLPGSPAEVEILGLFPSDNPDACWSAGWIEAARHRELEWEGGDPLEFGLDIGRFRDATSLHVRRGPCSLDHDTWRKTTIPSTAGRIYNKILEIAGLEEHEDAPYIVVRIGTSGWDVGVSELLEERLSNHDGIQVVGVNEGGNALDKRHFHNRRSELWLASADMGRTAELDWTRLSEENYKLLSKQLLSAEADVDSRGRKRIESKTQISARLSRSPDDADAYNMAYGGEGLRTPGGWGEGELQQTSKWAIEGAKKKIRAKTEDTETPSWGTTKPGGSRFRGRGL